MLGGRAGQRNAGVLVDARGAEVSGAHAELDLARLEVGEELVPLLRAQVAVFVAGTERSEADEEGSVLADVCYGYRR